MVGHHIAQRAGNFVERAALLHAHGFGRGDLDMIDTVAVPQRFEQAVGKAESHDVLHRFLAEEMVDTENLVFVERARNARIQRLGGGQIVAKWFFNDDTTPEFRFARLVALLVGQLGLAKLIDHIAKEPVAHGKIENSVAAGVVLLVHLGERLRQSLV